MKLLIFIVALFFIGCGKMETESLTPTPGSKTKTILERIPVDKIVIQDTLLHFPEARPMPDWRTALSDLSIPREIKVATIKKLGEDKLVEAVPLLLDNLTRIPYPQVYEGRMWPCKEALIRIGSPATNAIKNRFFIVGNPSEQYQLFSMLCEIEGGALIAYWLREVRHMVPLADMSKIDSYIRTAEELAGQQETADVK